MFEKIIPSVLYWLGIMAVSCILILVIFRLAYMGAPDEFWNIFGSVLHAVLVCGAVLAVCTEVVARAGRRERKKGK